MENICKHCVQTRTLALIKGLLAFWMLWCTVPVLAETREMRDSLRHELRLGWGDQLFETLNYYPNRGRGMLTSDNQWLRTCNYRYTQHLFLEYQYRVNHWFGAGGMLDCSAVVWDTKSYNFDYNQQLGFSNDHCFYNVVLMPTLRFSYLYTKYVSMHSGLGVGLNINGGTEVDAYGHHTVCAPVLNLTLVAVTVGYKHWFGAVEFGGMYSLLNQNQVFMFGSRLITASVGVRF